MAVSDSLGSQTENEGCFESYIVILTVRTKTSE